LKKDEYQKYYYEVESNENKFTIDIQILTGNITFYYGKTMTFNDSSAAYKFLFQSNEEFFTVKFGGSATFIRKWLKLAERRYFMVKAEKNSSYRIIVRRDEMMSALKPSELRYSS